MKESKNENRNKNLRKQSERRRNQQLNTAGKTQILDLADEDSKAAFRSKFKELKETMFKRLKKSMMTMIKQRISTQNLFKKQKKDKRTSWKFWI